MQLSPNQKRFSRFFSGFLESTRNLEYFEKKTELRKLFVSEIIDCKKAELLKRLESPLSEDLWTINMLNVPKHCLNLHRIFLNIFFN